MTDETGIGDFIGGINQAHIEPGNEDWQANSEPEDYITNAHGERFDPAIHRADANGDPIMTEKGRFRRKPGRKQGVKYGAINEPERPDPEAEEQQNRLTLAAETAASMYISTGVMIFGTEWLPDASKMEREQLVSAFEGYFRAKDITDIPPGIALALACFGYAAPRLYMQETQSRIARFSMWCKLKFGWIKFNASRPDIRPDRMRENNASKANGQSRGWFRRSGVNS